MSHQFPPCKCGVTHYRLARLGVRLVGGYLTDNVYAAASISDAGFQPTSMFGLNWGRPNSDTFGSTLTTSG